MEILPAEWVRPFGQAKWESGYSSCLEGGHSSGHLSSASGFLEFFVVSNFPCEEGLGQPRIGFILTSVISGRETSIPGRSTEQRKDISERLMVDLGYVHLVN